VVTNVAQLRQLARENAPAPNLRLEGVVWWANAAQGKFVLQDASGAEVLELEAGGAFPQSGERVRLVGTTTVVRRSFALRLGPKGPVVDNNGVHAMIEKSGAVFLPAGPQPVRIEWFNGVEGFGLAVECAGPELPRQNISALAAPPGWLIRYYEVAGNLLPDFSALPAFKQETRLTLQLTNLPRSEHIGAVITGSLAVPRPGLYTFFLKSDDGSRLFVGSPALQFTPLGPAALPKPQRITVGQFLPAEEGLWAEVEGKVTLARPTATGWQLELTAGAGHMLLEMGAAAGFSGAALISARIRATGFCRSVYTADGQSIAGILLVPSQREIELLEGPADPQRDAAIFTNANGLPVLTTAGAVHRLKRAEAQRAYPVKIRGVVTCVLPEHQAFTIQDGTRGIYVVDFSPSRPDPPQPGEQLEVAGTTDPGLFAPFVNAHQVSSLGAGRPPEPVKPTWDQLINGSLDAQQVELQGIVTAVHSNGLTLLMRGGVVKIELRLAGPSTLDLGSVENARVRLRGCLFASWDYVTHQVQMGNVRIYAADILVEQPAPPDLFSSPRKTARELLLFDPQAGVFQRVKVSGQIVHRHANEYFLMDGERGVRFTAKQPVALETGDTVDVVGFPDLLGSAAPVLREAVIRKTGHAPLPAARVVTADNLIQTDHDATRVKVEGLLLNIRQNKSDTVLEMQHGVRTFIAHLQAADGTGAALAARSRLELTGVYAGLGGNRAAGQDIAAFELLLQSAADIKVLARPAWWTLKRLLVIVGALACILAAAALWITQLHRQVEERTAELGAQIQERQRVEHQRAMAQERARIAQDLHDELGSGITEISMLAARARSATAPDEKRGGYLDHVGSKARELVTALDEIVWAMNPRHDSLASLVSYFSLYADRFLGLANIAWRLEGPGGAPDQVVDSKRRHQLFLAFKEALTNVVRHSGATEVRVNINGAAGELSMSIADNGRGLRAGGRAEDMDGVTNMRSRIEKLGGRFTITSAGGRGTTVAFHLPANFNS
jgi:signal transduction histidine kinase